MKASMAVRRRRPFAGREGDKSQVNSGVRPPARVTDGTVSHSEPPYTACTRGAHTSQAITVGLLLMATDAPGTPGHATLTDPTHKARRRLRTRRDRSPKSAVAGRSHVAHPPHICHSTRRASRARPTTQAHELPSRPVHDLVRWCTRMHVACHPTRTALREGQGARAFPLVPPHAPPACSEGHTHIPPPRALTLDASPASVAAAPST